MPWRKWEAQDTVEQSALPPEAYQSLAPIHFHRLFHSDSIINENLAQFGTGFEAVLLSPPWNFTDSAHPIFTYKDFVLHFHHTRRKK